MNNACSSAARGMIAAVCLLSFLGCGTVSEPEARVVVYTALDREFSEPILNAYSAASKVAVDAKFDVESTKTVGLTKLLIAEANSPRCDLFWNNEILNTLRLKKRGLLERWAPPSADGYPAAFRDPDGTWYGFAARARVIVVNADLVPEGERPGSILDLVHPRWKGKVGLAKPLFGTTATHATCLFQVLGEQKATAFFQGLKANEVKILSGNKQVASAVGAGEIAIGLTDTDDAIGEIEVGRPVVIIYPDRLPDQMGTLFIPNTLAIPKGASRAEQARKLGDYLLSAEVEARLAEGPSAQIPLNTKTRAKVRVETPATVKPMKVDFDAAVDLWDRVATYLASEFAG